MADLSEQTANQAIFSGEEITRPQGFFSRATQHMSIRGKILLGFLNIIVLIILIAVIAMAGQHYIAQETNEMLNTDSRLAMLSTEARTGVEQMVQVDMSFRQSVDQEGLEKAKAYIPRFLSAAAETQGKLAEMLNLAKADEMRGPSMTALESVNNYAAGFIAAANSMDEKYNEAFGLEHNLHEALEELEKAAAAPGVSAEAARSIHHLVASYYEYHAHQTNPEYATEVNAALGSLRRGLAQYPETLRAGIDRSSAEFQENFRALLRADQEIARHFEDVNFYAEEAGPALEVVRNGALEAQDRVAKQLDRTRTNLMLFVLLAALVALFLGIWLAWGISKSLTNQVDDIMELLGNLGIGDFDARTPVTSHDELGVMASNLNAMLDNMTAMIQTQDDQDRIQESFMALMQEIDKLTEGDLTVRAEVTEDITGALADSVNTMAEQFGTIVRQVQNASNAVDSTAAEVSRQTSELAGRSLEQSEQVNNAIVELQSIAESMREVSEEAVRSAEVSNTSRMNAREGAQAVEQTQRAMDEIREQINETARAIKRLGESSMEIGNVVEIINNIADRTSILALNASIQAAMAGEAGHGFAVVAEEVQRLAESSGNSTKQIETLIKSIQAEIKDAGNRMDESISKVVQGSQLADDAYNKLQEIETVSNRLADQINAIAQAGQEQAERSEQAVLSMAAVGEISTTTANSTQETNQLMSVLNETARELRATAEQFKVETADAIG